MSLHERFTNLRRATTAAAAPAASGNVAGGHVGPPGHVVGGGGSGVFKHIHANGYVPAASVGAGTVGMGRYHPEVAAASSKVPPEATLYSDRSPVPLFQRFSSPQGVVVPHRSSQHHQHVVQRRPDYYDDERPYDDVPDGRHPHHYYHDGRVAVMRSGAEETDGRPYPRQYHHQSTYDIVDDDVIDVDLYDESGIRPNHFYRKPSLSMEAALKIKRRSLKHRLGYRRTPFFYPHPPQFRFNHHHQHQYQAGYGYHRGQAYRRGQGHRGQAYPVGYQGGYRATFSRGGYRGAPRGSPGFRGGQGARYAYPGGRGRRGLAPTGGSFVGGGGGGAFVTKEELDNQLDSYMAANKRSSTSSSTSAAA